MAAHNPLYLMRITTTKGRRDTVGIGDSSATFPFWRSACCAFWRRSTTVTFTAIAFATSTFATKKTTKKCAQNIVPLNKKNCVMLKYFLYWRWLLVMSTG
jgi:hypothetical protein